MSRTRKVIVCGALFLVVSLVILLGSASGHAAKAVNPPGEDDWTRTGLAPEGRPDAPQTENPASRITNLSVVDSEVVRRTPETTYVWPRSVHNFSVGLDPGGANESLLIEFCVGPTRASSTNDTNASSAERCRKLSTKGDESGEFRLAERNLTTGEQTVTVGLHDPEANRTSSQRNLSVTVILPDDDLDGDGLTNAREAELGTELHLSDTDTDGLSDGAEVDNYRTNPLARDTDGDGLPDGEEISIGTNALVADTDGDGLDDGLEWNDLSTDPRNPDTDGDGLDDGAEHEDYETDPTNPDTDGDGITDGREVAVYGTDPTRVDTDRDGLHDRTEIRLNTDPTNPATVVGIELGAAGAVVLAGYLVWRSTAVRRAVGTRLSALIDSLEEREREGEEEGETTETAETTETTETADSTADDGATADDDPVEKSVLTDEDRIMKLLNESDGQLRQRELTELTEWSASKVSRLLSKMVEDGRVEKIKLGRENVVVIDEEDAGPDDTD